MFTYMSGKGENMTELQRVELNILKEFIRICDELQLTYYLVCGSALGAAKYEGFIPWDDDIDVALPRHDYDIFCEKAQNLLPKHLFLQNYKTDPNYPLYMSKIRDSRTTFIETLYRKIDMHHGIYIDVFPLDGYPNDNKEIEIFEKKRILYERRRLVRCSYNRFSKKNIRHPKAIVDWILYYFFGCWRDVSNLTEEFQLITSLYPCHSSILWCNHGNWQGKLEYAPKEQYGDGIIMKFEGIDVRVPEKYDEYLTQKYGDWRADLPQDKQIGHHYYKVCDVKHPYTHYVK